jgi:Aspartyl protease
VKSYRTSQENFLLSGLSIAVRISPPPDAGVEGFQAQPVLGLIDTGAATSMIRNEVAASIGLDERGSTRLQTFAGEYEVPQYPAKVEFDDGYEQELFLSGGDFEHDPGLDFLIGRDLLQHAHLCLHGPNGTLEITFRPEDAD